ncbi:MAG: hypothetical protein KJS91_08175 [Planctomycetes bacterium]|nr:hypothetical protein [Planctomycetota bacterium]
MSIHVSCTGCLKQLKLPDNATGRKVRCPMCQTTFVAQPAEEIEVLELVEPAPSKPVPPPVPRPSATIATPARPSAPPPRPAEASPGETPDNHAADEEPSAVPGGNRAGWRKVHSGLGLILLSIVLAIGAALALIGVSLLLAMTGLAAAQANGGFNRGGANPIGMGPMNREGMAALAGATMLVPLLAVGVGVSVLATFLVGHAFCMLVPAAKGNGGFARGLSVAAFCTFASVTGSWVGTILHYFYLWSICHALKKPSMARNVSNFMWAHVILVCGMFLGFLTGVILGTLGLTVVAGFLLVGIMMMAGAGSLALFIWYIVLLIQVRAAIEPLT